MSSPAPGMPPEFDCRATAALLRGMSPLVWASQAGAVIAAGYRHGWPSLACWLVVCYFSVRVYLDAGLLELMAQGSELHVDEWLARAGLRSRAQPRSLEDRCRGARRLARNLLAAWIAQMAALAMALYRGNA